MAQAAGRLSLYAVARDQSQAKLCEICGGKVTLEQGFLVSLVYISTFDKRGIKYKFQ
jgi:hypothetical protein